MIWGQNIKHFRCCTIEDADSADTDVCFRSQASHSLKFSSQRHLSNNITRSDSDKMDFSEYRLCFQRAGYLEDFKWLLFPYPAGKHEGAFLCYSVRGPGRAPGVSLRLVHAEPSGICQLQVGFCCLCTGSLGGFWRWVSALISRDSVTACLSNSCAAVCPATSLLCQLQEVLTFQFGQPFTCG